MPGLLGIALLVLAARNCGRLWRVPSWEVSWVLVAVTSLVTLFSAVLATGPASVGPWRWWTLVVGALAVFLLVVLVRDVRRLLRRWRPAAARP